MSNVRIMNQNFLDDDVISTRYVSSEQSAFPDENLYNRQRRSKVWRSNGFWKVVAGENLIIFRETVGVDLTATIPAVEYSSTTALLAAIKLALDTAGDSTYTMSTDATTGRIKFSSNLGGGGGIFQLMWTDSDSADMAAMLGFSTASNDTGASNYTADLLRIHTEERLIWDFGISTENKAFVAGGARNSPIKISPSATIKLQANTTNAWTTPQYETTLTYKDFLLSKFDEDGISGSQYRYWSMQIVDVDNPNLYVELGVVYLGDIYTTDRGRVQFPFKGAPKDYSTTIFSEGGQTFSDIREKSEEFTIEWFGLTIDDVEQLLEIFDDFGTSFPFFISFDPDAAFSTDADTKIRFVKFATEPDYELSSPGVFSMSMRLREEL